VSRSDTPLFSRYCFNGDESLETLSGEFFIFGAVGFEDFGDVCFDGLVDFDEACFECLFDFDFGGVDDFFLLGGVADFADGFGAGFCFLMIRSRR